MPAKKASTEPARKAATRRASSSAFTAEERAAMKEHAAEVRAARKPASKGAKAAAEAAAVVAKIAEMPPADRVLAQRLHEILTTAVPTLGARLWYGMPAYTKDGKVLCFFQPASKFKTRYGTFGFSDEAKLDDGTMWASSFAVTELGAAEEKKLRALVRRAVR